MSACNFVQSNKSLKRKIAPLHLSLLVITLQTFDRIQAETNFELEFLLIILVSVRDGSLATIEFILKFVEKFRKHR
jgi:hypothetical protein